MDNREEGLRTRLAVLKAKRPTTAADQANIQKNIAIVEEGLINLSPRHSNKTEARFDEPQRLRAPRDADYDMRHPSTEE
jgi:hypothetical protein